MFQIAPSAHLSFAIHVYLLAGDVLATWAVGIGILWESEALITRHEMARGLVFWGVVLETVCSLALFTFDEGISSAQQSTIETQRLKIIGLETEITPRTLTADQQTEMAEAFRPFSGLSVFLIVYPTDVEARRLAAQLRDALRKAGIQTPYDVHSCGRPEVNEPWGQVVTGVYVSSGDRPMMARLFGPALVAELNANGIEAEGGHLVHCNLPFGSVEVFVGVKPIAGEPPYNDQRP